MARIEKTVFISYRRTNVYLALAISQSLTHNGFDVFLDYKGIASGDFERVILENIRARAHFLVLLTPSALEHCNTSGDWLRREIEEALDTRRNIVPLMLDGFNFGTPTIASKLTGKLAALKHYNGLTIPAEYFDAAMAKLCEKFLNVPLDAVLHPASTLAQQAAKAQQTAAATAPPVQQRELSAQEWLEHGVNMSDPDERLRCYTEAVRLDPANATAYYLRGSERDDKGDHDGALKDLTEAIRLDPAMAMAYHNRGAMRYAKKDLDGSLQDFTEALRLDPASVADYICRGAVRYDKDDLDGAVQDFTEALRLDPASAGAYGWCGMTRIKKGDLDGALKDLTEAIRLDPADAMNYCMRGKIRSHRGDWDGARKDYTEALRLKPTLKTMILSFLRPGQRLI